jgi:protein LSM12
VNRIHITTVLQGHTVEGTIFAVCPFNGMVAIDSTPAPPNPSTNISNEPSDYHLIPIANIQSFKLLSLAPSPTGTEGAGSNESAGIPSITKLDMQALKGREEAEIQRLKQRDEMKARGVSKEAQEIMDHFGRLYDTEIPHSSALTVELTLQRYNTRWHGTSIIVDDAVRIDPPYKTENCKAPKEKQVALTQMKKVLEGYYQKKKTAASAPTGRENRPQPATPILRKGG